jgi:hypothetical protein
MTVWANSLVVLVLGSVAVTTGQGTGRDAAIARAKSTLAESVAVAADQVELVGAREAQWRDSSLGCPQHGMVYTPALTSGYQVTLGVGRDRFVVHATPDRAVICGKPRAASGDARDAKLPPADAIVGLRLAEQARQDLASRLHVGSDRVTVNSFKRTAWPDRSLGCPVQGQAYPPQPTRGFLIELATGGKTYHYHSDMNQAVACGVGDGSSPAGSPPKVR